MTAKLHLAKIFLSIMVGVLVGIGMFTFHYAKGFSYFSKDPEACANCHIMEPQLDSWRKASHHTVALCNDCHLPTGFLSKYIAKADNGWRHSKGFTLQNFPEPIQITQSNKDILHENCIRCHSRLLQSMEVTHAIDLENANCVHCHRDVGHGETVGLGGFDETLEAKKL